MMCLFCKKPMAIRSGPYGDFYYCQYGNHGTISVEKYKKIAASIPQEGLPIGGNDPLMMAVERAQSVLGYGAMTDLERFYIDSPVYDEDNFWQDARPHG